MGAWGAGIFDNDDAADWVYELEQAGDDSVLAETLAAVANAGADAYVEAPDAAAALAAAAVVAAALTGSHDVLVAGGPYAEGALRWVEADATRVRSELAPLALSAVRRARDKSELRDLWDEAGADEWLAAVAEVERGLASGS
jgi:hypothetical protein